MYKYLECIQRSVIRMYNFYVTFSASNVSVMYVILSLENCIFSDGKLIVQAITRIPKLRHLWMTSLEFGIHVFRYENHSLKYQKVVKNDFISLGAKMDVLGTPPFCKNPLRTPHEGKFVRYSYDKISSIKSLITN